MTNSELIYHLKALPPDAEVNVDIEVESGFYDVPARHARGVLFYVQHYDFAPDQGITLKARQR